MDRLEQIKKIVEEVTKVKSEYGWSNDLNRGKYYIDNDDFYYFILEPHCDKNKYYFERRHNQSYEMDIFLPIPDNLTEFETILKMLVEVQ
jgi:hypothetical protein